MRHLCATNSAALLLILAAFGSSAIGASCEHPAEATTDIGKVASPEMEIKAGGLPATYRAVPEITPRYYMLHFAPSAGSTGDWTLTLRDPSFHVLEVLNSGDLAESAGGRWTGRLPAQEIVLDFYAAAGSGAKVVLDEAIIMPEKTVNPRYSWQGNAPRYTPLYAFTAAIEEKNRVLRLGDRVGFLIGSGPATQGPVSWCCSGVMLTKDLYLTNWHCGAPTGIASGVWHKDRCATTLIDLSWDEDGVSREVGCSEVVASSERLDYALLRVAPVAGSARAAIIGRPLPVSSRRAATSDALIMVHHAECKRKLLSKSCKVVNASYKNWRDDSVATDFSHDCDTEGGSSGAPMFDSTGALIGLHHLGFALDQHNACDKQNKAVHIADILYDIQQTKPTVFDEIERQITHTNH